MRVTGRARPWGEAPKQSRDPGSPRRACPAAVPSSFGAGEACAEPSCLHGLRSVPALGTYDAAANRTPTGPQLGRARQRGPESQDLGMAGAPDSL